MAKVWTESNGCNPFKLCSVRRLQLGTPPGNAPRKCIDGLCRTHRDKLHEIFPAHPRIHPPTLRPKRPQPNDWMKSPHYLHLTLFVHILFINENYHHCFWTYLRLSISYKYRKLLNWKVKNYNKQSTMFQYILNILLINIVTYFILLFKFVIYIIFM